VRLRSEPRETFNGGHWTSDCNVTLCRETPIFDQAKNIIEYLARGVEFAAALVIGIAAVEATIKALRLFVDRAAPASAKNEVRLTLGRWLAVGLEFELAADILRTAITPTWRDIEQLVAIAALRTALNYFLEREIRQESAPEQRHAENVVMGPRPVS
jgi:uncharacterized membrane protein